MWYALGTLCSIYQSICGFYFSKGTLHNKVALYLVPVKIYPFIMREFVCVKTALHPSSKNFPMGITELCVSTSRIWPSIDFGGSCGNDNLHLLVDIIFPPFGRPTVIGVFLGMFC